MQRPPAPYQTAFFLVNCIMIQDRVAMLSRQRRTSWCVERVRLRVDSSYVEDGGQEDGLSSRLRAQARSTQERSFLYDPSRSSIPSRLSLRRPVKIIDTDP